MRQRLSRYDFVAMWLLVVVTGLICRPLTPVDETRAVSVAWEMWLSGNPLVPHLNGEPYSHKPPLLQWCMQLGWLVFGVHEWVARSIVPLFALGNLFLTRALARRLWPEEPRIEALTPWLLLGIPVWQMWTTLTLYDMLTTCFTLVGLIGIVRAATGEVRAGWLLAGLGIGGGVLAKGPVILLLVLPVALAAPWWMPQRPLSGWGSWYRQIFWAVLLGALIGLAWAIPAGFAGGEEYRRMIFWGQSAGRIAHSFAHKRPFWWYLKLLPLLWLPWFVWPWVWRSLHAVPRDWGLRFCLIQAGAVLVIFSLISGKQIHYLFPAFPSLALVIARALTAWPIDMRRAALRMPGVMLALLGVAGGLLRFVIPADAKTGFAANEVVRMIADAPVWLPLGYVLGGCFLVFLPVRELGTAVRRLAGTLVVMIVLAHLVYARNDVDYFDMSPMAEKLAGAQNEGRGLVWFGKYHGDFNFLSRLETPIVLIDRTVDFKNYLAANPEAYAMLVYDGYAPELEVGTIFAQFYRGARRIVLWKAADLLAHPDILRETIRR